MTEQKSAGGVWGWGRGLASGKGIRARMGRDMEGFDRMGWESQNDENSREETINYSDRIYTLGRECSWISKQRAASCI